MKRVFILSIILLAISRMCFADSNKIWLDISAPYQCDPVPWGSNDTLKGFFEKEGINIYDIKLASRVVCKACGCPSPQIIVILIDNNDLIKIEKLIPWIKVLDNSVPPKDIESIKKCTKDADCFLAASCLGCNKCFSKSPLEPTGLDCAALCVQDITLNCKCKEGKCVEQEINEVRLLSLSDQEKIWVEIDPVQCLGNPWEKDWLSSHNNDYSVFKMRLGEYTSEIDTEEIEIIKNYYQKLGITVFDVKAKWTHENEAICEACDCPQGYTLYLFISNADFNKMLEMGYKISHFK